MRPTLITTVLACSVLSLAASVSAQTVYRIVGPDGKVSFSDQPPPPTSKARVTTAAPGGGSAVNASLPFELKEVVQRYPVTLYTSASCSPCASARNLLVSRGVPFTERTVNTAEDVDALKRLAGEASLPLATLGAQQLKGYSEAEWTQYLDAAGYPRQSQLPASYRRPAPAPLAPVVARPATPAAASAPAERPRAGRPDAAAPPAPARNPANPAGIIF